MEQQTAVEWLFQELEAKGELRETIGIVQLNIFTSDYLDLKRKAKEMEKEQIVNSWDLSRRDIDYPANGEQYYNETYKNK